MRRGTRSSSDENGEHEAEEGWLLSYADLVTLLLAVFVLLFSMSTLDQKKMNELGESMSKYLTENRVGKAGAPDITSTERRLEALNRLSILLNLGNPDDVLKRLLKLQEASEEVAVLRELAQRLGLAAGVTAAPIRRGVEIVLPANVLFSSGASAMSVAGRDVLTKLSPTLQGALKDPKNTLEVLGHTDSKSLPKNHPLKTNVTLSLARARAVFGVLVDAGLPDTRIAVSGRGSMEPVAAETGSPLERAAAEARNRRVVLRVLAR